MDFRKCQTATATPAKPGGFPFGLNGGESSTRIGRDWPGIIGNSSKPDRLFHIEARSDSVPDSMFYVTTFLVLFIHEAGPRMR